MSIRKRIRSGGIFSRLHRYPREGWVAGVCQGLAEFFDWNVKLIRVLFILSFIVSGFFPVGVIYLILWYLMENGDDTEAREPPRPRHRRHADAARPVGPNELKLRFSRLEHRLRDLEACVTSGDFELRREFRKLES